MRAQVYVANALPEHLARIGQDLTLSGTTHGALGFGAWGIEPTTVVDFEDVTGRGLYHFLRTIFIKYQNEEALYVTVDGEGQTVYRINECNLPDITLPITGD